VSVVVVRTEENWNFSAVHSPIELKPGGDLGLVSQISVLALVSRLTRLFTFYKQTNKKKNAKIAKIVVLQNLRCLPFRVRLI
jgi:hypothetical protein